MLKLLFAFGIFKVIYSPVKAFREILQNPKYNGPILILILFTAANTGYLYLRATKTFYEQTLPDAASLKDEWTESKSFWSSNATLNESTDSLNVGYYGNKSIQFSTDNGKQIWMQLNLTEPITCSGVDGYKNLTFWVKMIYPNTTQLTNATLHLFSSATNYFSYQLPKTFLQPNETLWNKLNVPLGPESELQWTKNGDADWNNITSLKLDFVWFENTNLTVRLDGLFFRGLFKSTLEIVGASTYPIYTLLTSTMQFFVSWVFLGGLTFLIAKGLGAKVLWKPSLILIGFVLITLFLQTMINVVMVASWPQLYGSLEFFGGVEGERQVAQNELFSKIVLSSQINDVSQMVLLVWTVALCAVAVRLLTEFSWSKSFLVSIVAYFVSNMAISFLMAY